MGDIHLTNLQKAPSLIQQDVNARYEKGRTRLHLAAHDHDNKLVAALIQHKADVNALDEDGWGPLHVAVLSGNDEATQLLLEAGAYPE